MPWKSKVHNPLPLATRRAIANKRAREEYRSDPHRWMYNLPEWRNPKIGIKHARLAMEPSCRECAKADIVTAATEVDHIIPHRGDMDLFISIENTQSLCRRHHSMKTAREKRR